MLEETVLKESLDNHKVLLRRIAEGDEKAFGVLFYEHFRILKLFALNFTKSEYASEEIIQNSFLKIWLNRDKLKEVDNVKAYLYKCVSNECLSFLRASLRKSKANERLKDHQPNHNNDTIDTINLNEVNKIIRLVVDNLPSQRKKIYELSRLECKTIPEIATTLNLSPNTVKNALVISLKTIRTQLVNYGFKIALLGALLNLLF